MVMRNITFRVLPAMLMAGCGWFTALAVYPAEASINEAHPGSEAFIAELAEQHDVDADALRELLADGEYRQSIIDAITRPAEGKPWHEYRQIFLTGRRIGEGREFWREHADLVQEIATRYAIPPEVILAIAGVETSYGRITGSYRVLDALVTLGFYYEPRGAFFRSELGELVQLASEEQIPLNEVTGSYAGAMGLGQFIPSSYRAYAVDFDADGKRDLWQSLPDALGSVANYLHVHKWEPGAAIAVPASVEGDVSEVLDGNLKPSRTIAELRELGVSTAEPLGDDVKASVIRLDGVDGPEYWLGLQNFYVITRYNRSPLYAMAVTQLSQALRAAYIRD